MVADAINGAARRLPPWTLYALAPLPPVLLVWAGATGRLGVEPVEAMEHQLGTWALQLLILGLAITPLRRFAGVNLVRFRRAIGVVAFAYVLLHALVWAVLDVQSLSRVIQDVLKRPYITIGMAALVLLLPLAATSNDAAVRWLRARWRSLHKLTYPAVLLGAVHWVMLEKVWWTEALVYLAIAVALLALRVIPTPARRA